MKKLLLNLRAGIIFTATIMLMAGNSQSQTVVNFEGLSLGDDSYWNGSDASGGFTSENVVFENDYNQDYYSWTGFAYSNKIDVTTEGYGNQYSVFTGQGYDGSSNFVIANAASYASNYIKPASKNAKFLVKGFYITNVTYAALSMLKGDQFSKKFGGAEGTDKDSLVVSVKGYVNGDLTEDSANFVLADFRFDNSEEDYIVNSWEWFDLTSLGYVDSIKFTIFSSDNGEYGINTPTYFAMDNFTFEQTVTSLAEKSTVEFFAYPNPVASNLVLDLTSLSSELTEISISDVQGMEVYKLTENAGRKLNLLLEKLNPGLYVVSVKQNNNVSSLRLIKQ